MRSYLQVHSFLIEKWNLKIEVLIEREIVLVFYELHKYRKTSFFLIIKNEFSNKKLSQRISLMVTNDSMMKWHWKTGFLMTTVFHRRFFTEIWNDKIDKVN